MTKTPFQSRIKIISVFVAIIAFVIIVKLFYVQIIKREVYALKADRLFSSYTSGVFDRGSIYFSKKDGSLVSAGIVSTGFKVAINPKDLVDAEDAYKSLDQFIDMDHDTFINRAGKKNDPYEEITSHLTEEEANAINDLKIKGVSIYKDNWRFYPNNSMASHALGFLAYKGDDRVGQYGLERFYDKTLSKPKDEAYVNFFAEVFSDIKENISKEDERGDIVTTIEPLVQETLESELGDALSKWNADQAGGIIMNPMNGEIYAMVGLPDFDLNNFKEVDDIGVYRNPLVENVLEFGSVIKPLVMLGAIDSGVVNPNTTYMDNGKVVVDKKEIYNFDKKGRGLVTMQDVLNQSLNTGMVFAESKLGHEKFRNYMKSYGIGTKTGIDLPNETSGLIKNLESPRNIEYANASFGQGIALTPVEAIRAFSIIANGGNLVTPHLAKQIRYSSGFSRVIDYPIVRDELIKTESTDTITQMLTKVYESYEGGKYKFDHYSVATKTGTAQVAREDGKGYYEDRHTHSFFGYFPAYNPEFVVFIYLKNPKGIKYASQTLIPPFANITKFLLNYYNVPPDR